MQAWHGPREVLIVATLALVLAGAQPVLATDGLETEDRVTALKSLHWLEGTWRRQSRRGHVDETWRILGDHTMAGEAYLYDRASGARQLGESLLLVVMGSEIFYIARPVENDYPVGFRLISRDDDKVVFENPGHDFPTKITYRRVDPDAMMVTVTGPGDGESAVQSIDFKFTRVR